MRREYSEQEMQDILSGEQKISPKVEQRIQETYEMLGVKNAEKKTIHKKIAGWKKALTCAAACAALLTTVTVVRPTWAEELFGKAFQNLVDSSKGTKYEKEDTTLYTQVGKEAKNLKEEGQTANQEQVPAEAAANGITLTATDVYCDGYRLYYTVKMTTDREEMNQSDFITIDSKETEQSPSLAINGREVSSSGFTFTKGTDGSYYAMGSEDLLYLEKQEGVTRQEEGTLDVTLNLYGLWGFLEDEWEEGGEYKGTDKVLGDWKFGFTADIDTSKNKTWEINEEKNGITVTKVTRTSANLIVEMKCPDFSKEPYNDEYNDPAILLFDSQKEMIPMDSGYAGTLTDGISEQYLTCLYDGDTTLHLQVINKNVDDSILAEFELNLSE